MPWDIGEVAPASPSTPVAGSSSGFFNYESTLAAINPQSDQWTTLPNNGAGLLTETRFSPPNVSSMLDTATGRILLSQLSVGDEVYVRYTLDVIPYINGATVSFSNLIGSGAGQYRVPFSINMQLNDGAGTPTGDFSVDTRFYIRDQNSIDGGLLPQIKVSGGSEVSLSSCYLSVRRRD